MTFPAEGWRRVVFLGPAMSAVWPTPLSRWRIPLTLGPVPFLQPDAPGREGSQPGSIDYRLARRQLLRRLRAGEVSRGDVCDAQRELIRVANNHSRKATVPCPVCGEQALRLVSYVFAPRLPAGGRVVENRADLKRLAARYGGKPNARTYTVEVCIECGWNHLLDIVPLFDPAQR